jgi:hypothetical protein
LQASSPSPQDFCRDAKLMQSWLFTIQKAKTSFATDLLMVRFAFKRPFQFRDLHIEKSYIILTLKAPC